MDRFLCLDVETASRYNRGSICQLAIVEYDGEKIVPRFSSLINPKCSFDPLLRQIHHIHPEDVKNAPVFAEIWPAIAPLLASLPVVCHNAIFDMTAIEKAIYDSKLEPIDIRYTCSLMASRRAYMGLKSYKLGVLCEHLGIPMTQAHDAYSDAIACAMLTLRAAEELNARSLQELVWRCGSTFCSTLTNDYTPGEEGQEQSSEDSYIDSFSLMPSLNIDCTDKDFFNGKVIAFTGEMYNMLRSEAIQAAENLGAIYNGDSISRKTQILVIGKQDMHRTKGSKLSSKQKKAIDNRNKGYDIVWIDEGEFISLLSMH